MKQGKAIPIPIVEFIVKTKDNAPKLTNSEIADKVQAEFRMIIDKSTVARHIKRNVKKSQSKDQKTIITDSAQNLESQKQNQSNKDALVLEARHKHLEEISDLIKQWKFQIKVPEIAEVDLKVGGVVASCEDNPLFISLKNHLPSKELWKDYQLWLTRASQYVGLCQELRRSIRASWNIKQVKLNQGNFEQPILNLISGRIDQLRYKLFVIEGRDLSDYKHQELYVNDGGVLAGPESSSGKILVIPNTKWDNNSLPGEYQKLADYFLSNEETIKIKEKLQKLRNLESIIVSRLDEALLSRDYILHTCARCVNFL